MKAHLSAMLLVVLYSVFPAQALRDTPVGTSPDVVSASSPQRVSYVYDEADNRTSRIIVLQSASRKHNKRNGKSPIKPNDNMVPLTDVINGHEVCIYPNPTQGLLIVKISGSAEEIVTIKIVDMQGRLIEQKECVSSIVEFDLTRQPSGTAIS